MKKLLIVLLSLGLVTGVSAQRGHIGGGFHGGGYHYIRPHVTVVYGGAFSPFYPYYGFGYYPFGYPYPPAYGYSRPSKLTLQIEDIKNDYHDKIWSVKQDKSLTHKQRREKVRELKHERDQAIDDAKRNYYKQ